MRAQPLVVLFNPDSDAASDHVSVLNEGGFRTAVTGAPSAALTTIEREAPSAVVVVESSLDQAKIADLTTAARGRGIPVVGLVRSREGTPSPPDGPFAYDARLELSTSKETLMDHLSRTLHGRTNDTEIDMVTWKLPIDTRLLELIVHDIRNPLNVISLTLRILEQLPPSIKSVIGEDLTYLEDNSSQITRILTLISHYSRLAEGATPPGPLPIETEGFVRSVTEERPARGLEKAYPIRVESTEACPKTVHLDPSRLQLIVQLALGNAAGAADRPLTIRLDGSGDRWQIAIRVDRPPAASVEGGPVRIGASKRLLGNDTERAGFDLELAEALAEEMGGTIRIDVEPGKSSTTVIDLPVRKD